MEIIPAPSRQYAFTLRRTNLKKGVTQEDYNTHLMKWENKGICKLIDSIFEYEAGIHMHGIIDIPKSVDLKHFRVRGWNIKLEELFDETGWRVYMMKHQQVAEDNESMIEETKLNNLKYSLFKSRGATASDV